MNWETLTEELCEANGCSHKQMLQVGNDRKQLRKLEKQRREIQAAGDAVRQAYEANPAGTREQVRNQAYKLLTGSVILTILLQALLSVLIKYAIEWFLDRIYNSQEPSNGALPISSE